jgi:hypothetical protein
MLLVGGPAVGLPQPRFEFGFVILTMPMNVKVRVGSTKGVTNDFSLCS